MNTLTNYSCLIIDALDKEHFDSRQSYVFYRLVDAQLTRLKPGSMIIATSKDLPLLADHFEEGIISLLQWTGFWNTSHVSYYRGKHSTANQRTL